MALGSKQLRSIPWRVIPGAHVAIYRLTRGRVGGRFPGGAPILLLDHVGRRSGAWRTAPLLYLPDGDDMVIVGSKGGHPRHPSWFVNLREMKETTVQRGAQTIPVSVSVANAEERTRLWPKVVDLYKSYAAYQKRTKREIPVVILRPLGTESGAETRK